MALFDYDPSKSCTTGHPERELKLKEGEYLTVFGDMDMNGCYEAELNGVRGLVPSLYVEEVEEDNESLKDEVLKPKSRRSPSRKRSPKMELGPHVSSIDISIIWTCFSKVRAQLGLTPKQPINNGCWTRSHAHTHPTSPPLGVHRSPNVTLTLTQNLNLPRWRVITCPETGFGPQQRMKLPLLSSLPLLLLLLLLCDFLFWIVRPNSDSARHIEFKSEPPQIMNTGQINSKVCSPNSIALLRHVADTAEIVKV